MTNLELYEYARRLANKTRQSKHFYKWVLEWEKTRKELLEILPKDRQIYITERGYD